MPRCFESHRGIPQRRTVSKSMNTLGEVRDCLRELAASGSFTPDEREKLQECFTKLRSETAMQSISDGQPLPRINYNLHRVRDHIERALDACDFATAKDEIHSAWQRMSDMNLS